MEGLRGSTDGTILTWAEPDAKAVMGTLLAPPLFMLYCFMIYSELVNY